MDHPTDTKPQGAFSALLADQDLVHLELVLRRSLECDFGGPLLPPSYSARAARDHHARLASFAYADSDGAPALSANRRVRGRLPRTRRGARTRRCRGCRAARRRRRQEAAARRLTASRRSKKPFRASGTAFLCHRQKVEHTATFNACGASTSRAADDARCAASACAGGVRRASRVPATRWRSRPVRPARPECSSNSCMASSRSRCLPYLNNR